MELKGGINALTMRGFAGAVQFLDIISSTINLSPPRFPIARTLQDGRGLPEKQLDFELAWIATPAINRLTLFGLSRAILDIMLDMSNRPELLRTSYKYQVEMANLSLLTARRKYTPVQAAQYTRLRSGPRS